MGSDVVDFVGMVHSVPFQYSLFLLPFQTDLKKAFNRTPHEAGENVRTKAPICIYNICKASSHAYRTCHRYIGNMKSEL